LAGRRPQRPLLNSTPQLNDVSPPLKDDEIEGVDEFDGNYNGAGPALHLKNFDYDNIDVDYDNIDVDDEVDGNYNGAGVAGNVGNVAGNVGGGGNVDNDVQVEGAGKRKNVCAVIPVADPAEGRLFVLSSLLDVVAQFKATVFNSNGAFVESVDTNEICPLWWEAILESELSEVVAYDRKKI
jgi:hypothetical protein